MANDVANWTSAPTTRQNRRRRAGGGSSGSSSNPYAGYGVIRNSDGSVTYVRSDGVAVGRQNPDGSVVAIAPVTVAPSVSNAQGMDLTDADRAIMAKAGFTEEQYRGLETGAKSALAAKYASGELTTTREARESAQFEVTDSSGNKRVVSSLELREMQRAQSESETQRMGREAVERYNVNETILANNPSFVGKDFSNRGRFSLFDTGVDIRRGGGTAGDLFLEYRNDYRKSPMFVGVADSGYTYSESSFLGGLGSSSGQVAVEGFFGLQPRTNLTTVEVYRGEGLLAPFYSSHRVTTTELQSTTPANELLLSGGETTSERLRYGARYTFVSDEAVRSPVSSAVGWAVSNNPTVRFVNYGLDKLDAAFIGFGTTSFGRSFGRGYQPQRSYDVAFKTYFPMFKVGVGETLGARTYAVMHPSNAFWRGAADVTRWVQGSSPAVRESPDFAAIQSEAQLSLSRSADRKTPWLDPTFVSVPTEYGGSVFGFLRTYTPRNIVSTGEALGGATRDVFTTGEVDFTRRYRFSEGGADMGIYERAVMEAAARRGYDADWQRAFAAEASAERYMRVNTLFFDQAIFVEGSSELLGRAVYRAATTRRNIVGMARARGLATKGVSTERLIRALPYYDRFSLGARGSFIGGALEGAYGVANYESATTGTVVPSDVVKGAAFGAFFAGASGGTLYAARTSSAVYMGDGWRGVLNRKNYGFAGRRGFVTLDAGSRRVGLAVDVPESYGVWRSAKGVGQKLDDFLMVYDYNEAWGDAAVDFAESFGRRAPRVPGGRGRRGWGFGGRGGGGGSGGGRVSTSVLANSASSSFSDVPVRVESERAVVNVNTDVFSSVSSRQSSSVNVLTWTNVPSRVSTSARNNIFSRVPVGVTTDVNVDTFTSARTFVDTNVDVNTDTDTNINTDVIVPVNPTGFGFPAFPFGGGGSGRRGGRLRRSKRRYVPSFAAFALGVRGKRLSGLALKSGLALRPIDKW